MSQDPNQMSQELPPELPLAARKRLGMGNFQAFREQRLANDITQIHQALVVNVEVKQITEGTFVQEILPVLTGAVVSSDFPLLMAAVAGNPFMEVDVTDAAGNVLFRMPSLLERDIISHKEASKRGSLENMFITAEMVMRMSPRRAESYLEHELNGRGIATNRDELYKKRQDRWNVILARYGYTLHADGTVIATNQPASKGGAQNREKPQLDFGDDDLL